MTKLRLASAFALALMLTANPSRAEDPYTRPVTADEVAADLLLQRPFGLVATAVGTAIFIVGLPFTLVNGSTQQAANKLIGEPAQFTFTRPLGRSQ